MRLGSRNLCHENFRQKHLFVVFFEWCVVFEIISQRITCCSFHPFYREHSIELAAFIKSQIYHAALHCNCQRKERALGK